MGALCGKKMGMARRGDPSMWVCAFIDFWALDALAWQASVLKLIRERSNPKQLCTEC
jgi:hypothetical protein